MVNYYSLVNPNIQGKFKNVLKAKNSNEAASLFYTNISKYFSNSIPQFCFTIQKGKQDTGKYYHYQVNEERKNNEVNYVIKSLDVVNEEGKVIDFKNKLEKFKHNFDQEGGKKNIKNIKNTMNQIIHQIHLILPKIYINELKLIYQ